MFVYCNNNPVSGFDPFGRWNIAEKMTLGLGVLLIGVAILAAVPTGGTSLVIAGTGLAISASTVTAIGATVAVAGLVIMGDATIEATVNFAKTSRKSGKEKANDKPSYVSRNDVDPNKSSKENAKDIMDRQFGPGNWGKGPGSDYSKIKKWIERSLLSIIIEVFFEEEVE